jgi:hypothetical protein
VQELEEALKEAIAPLEGAQINTVAIGSLHGVFEPLAALSLVEANPALSDLGFTWLETTVAALETQFSLALDQVPERLYPARLCLVAALECLVPLLRYTPQGSSSLQRERIVWAAEALRGFVEQCRQADLAARDPPDNPPADSLLQAEKLLGQLAFSLSRLLEAAADSAQAVATDLAAHLDAIESQQDQLDAAMDGIASLASLLSRFDTARGVPAWSGSSAPSEQQLARWLQLKGDLYLPVEAQIRRLLSPLAGHSAGNRGQFGLDPAVFDTCAPLPEAVAAQMGRASRWVAQLLGAGFQCSQVRALEACKAVACF